MEMCQTAYQQMWPAYNKSQQEEKARFMTLLNDLCNSIEEPAYEFGRPRISLHDLIFASALKVYTRFSLRRFQSDLADAKEKEFVQAMPCFASVGHFFQKTELTAILSKLITLSAAPLRGIESDFAIDSTGFRTTKFYHWLDEKHRLRRKNQWIKIHIACGVKSNIVTAVQITEEHGADYPQLKYLVEKTAQDFHMNEVSADRAYLGRDNLAAIANVGAAPYIPFKSNSKGNKHGSMIWSKLYYYFMYNQEEFMTHYHKRSNVESTMNMIKAKFGDEIKSRDAIAQFNEALLKVLCHNIVVVIHETNELEIYPPFNNRKSDCDRKLSLTGPF